MPAFAGNRLADKMFGHLKPCRSGRVFFKEFDLLDR
jgi:hypothetical protein